MIVLVACQMMVSAPAGAQRVDAVNRRLRRVEGTLAPPWTSYACGTGSAWWPGARLGRRGSDGEDRCAEHSGSKSAPAR